MRCLGFKGLGAQTGIPFFASSHTGKEESSPGSDLGITVAGGYGTASPGSPSSASSNGTLRRGLNLRKSPDPEESRRRDPVSVVGHGLVQAMATWLAVAYGKRREEAEESPPEPTCADGAGSSSHTLQIPASWITLGRVCAIQSQPKSEPECKFTVSLWAIPLSRQGSGAIRFTASLGA